MYSFFGSGDLDFLEHFDGSLHAFAFGAFLMQNEHLGNLIADAIHRVQGGHGFLKNHGDSISPNGPHLLHGKRDDISSVKKDFAVHESCPAVPGTRRMMD